MRINAYIPDALAEEIRERFPDLNVSAVLQSALRGLIECRHHELACRRCGGHVLAADVVHRATNDLFAELVDALNDLMVNGGTVEGATRVAFNVARRHNVRLAYTRPLPRLTRAEREERRAS